MPPPMSAAHAPGSFTSSVNLNREDSIDLALHLPLRAVEMPWQSVCGDALAFLGKYINENEPLGILCVPPSLLPQVPS